MKTIKICIAFIVLLLVYLLAWPVPIDPKVWDAPDLASYRAPFEPNQLLSAPTKLSLNKLLGPEAIIQKKNGEMFATSHEGWLLRWMPESDQINAWINVGGRPLGIDFDQDDNLWVANAYLGLMKVTPAGEVSVELTHSDNIAIRYADDVVVAPNGKIYLSDATTKFAAKDWGGTLEASLLDLIEHGYYGRIIEYDPITKLSRVIMDGLSFANGVAIDPAGQFLLVAETGEYRVWKYWLAGNKQGQQEVIINNLPGFPDNIHLGKNGRFWVGLTSPRSDIMDILAGAPFWRKVAQRLPEFMQPKLIPYGLVFAIDANGEVLHNLQAPNGEVYATTGAYETQSYLFVASLTAPYVARYEKIRLGIE